MDSTPTRERLAKCRTEYAQDLDSKYEEFKRRALQEFDRQWSIAAQTSKATPSTRPAASKVGDKQSGTPPRREMVLEALPESRDDTFTRADIPRRESLRSIRNLRAAHSHRASPTSSRSWPRKASLRGSREASVFRTLGYIALVRTTRLRGKSSQRQHDDSYVSATLRWVQRSRRRSTFE